MYLDPSFITKLFSYHNGDARFLIKEDLFGYIIQLCNQFKHFALSLNDFVKLSNVDQAKLLHQNTPIYVQLILSMYFNGQSGLDQLKCLPGIEPQHNVFYPRIRLEKMNRQLGLFHPSFNIHQYQLIMSSPQLQVDYLIPFDLYLSMNIIKIIYFLIIRKLHFITCHIYQQWLFSTMKDYLHLKMVS